MPSRLLSLWICLCLIGITLAAYAQVRECDFINLDDHQYALDNPHVLTGLSEENFVWAWTTFDASNWHPLTWLSLQWDAHFFGQATEPVAVQHPLARAIHVGNVLWHAASVTLLFLLLSWWTGAQWRSALVAGLFALHPLHVESVAWVAERKDVLSVFFGLATLAVYSWYALRPRWTRYLTLMLCFALSLLAKPMMVTLPCVLMLLDWWPWRRLRLGADEAAAKMFSPRSAGWLILEKVPLLIVACASSVMTILAQRAGTAFDNFESLPFALRLQNAAVAYVWYLEKTFWPVHLAIFYPHPEDTLQAWHVGLAVVLLAGVTVLLLSQARRRPALLVGWLWFLGTLVPVLGLLQAGGQAYADRYAYWPHVGLFLTLVWAAAEACERWRVPTWLTATVSGCLLATLAARTYDQITVWHNDSSVWTNAVQVTPNNFLGHRLLGIMYCLRGHMENAEYHLDRSLQLRPNAQAFLCQGKVREAKEDWAGAAASYRRSVEVEDNPEARQRLSEMLFRLEKTAEAQLAAGHRSEAEATLELAMRMALDAPERQRLEAKLAHWKRQALP